MTPDRDVGSRFVGKRPPGGLGKGKEWRVVQRGDKGPEVWQVTSTVHQMPTFDDLPPGEPPPDVGSGGGGLARRVFNTFMGRSHPEPGERDG